MGLMTENLETQVTEKRKRRRRKEEEMAGLESSNGEMRCCRKGSKQKQQQQQQHRNRNPGTDKQRKKIEWGTSSLLGFLFQSIVPKNEIPFSFLHGT